VRRIHAGRLFPWLLLTAWFGVIWHFGEAQILAGPWSYVALRWFLRKSAHMVVYGVLGGLFVSVSGSRPRFGWIMSVCVMVALADEVHQQFVPGRTFALHDVALDVIGGMLGTLCAEVGRIVVNSKRADSKAFEMPQGMTSPSGHGSRHSMLLSGGRQRRRREDRLR
jgi:hypothetical protein